MNSSPECEVCQIFLEAANAVLQDDYDCLKRDPPHNHPRWYYHRKARKWPLGAKAFAPSSGCTAHLTFLQAMLPSFEDLSDVQKESLILHLGSAAGMYLQFTAQAADGSRPKGAELLVVSPSRHQGPAMGRFVDRSYVDLDLVRQWRSFCDTHHGEECSKRYVRSTMCPAWLLDTEQECLVEGTREMRYVALSYVWGRVDMLKTERVNLAAFREPGAFGHGMVYLPQTIRDAIGLLPLIGEKYLWVDSLCIVQDDDESLLSHLHHMAGIYENAELTLVANDGIDANHGLRGLRGLSRPRVLQPELKLTDTASITGCQNQRFFDTPWSSRGWTMQETLFSRRRLHFVDNSIHWVCRANVYHEDVDTPLDLQYLDWSMLHGKGASNPEQELSWTELAFDYPEIGHLKTLVSYYKYRDFSYEEDVFSALLSTLNAFQQRAFPRGFLHAIPISFFDDVFLWRSNMHGARLRQPSHPSRKCPPSWTWAGWKADHAYESWNYGNYVKYPPWNEVYLTISFQPQVIPSVKWYTCASPNGEWNEIEYQNERYDYKTLYMGKEEGLPPGWKFERDTIDYNDGYIKRRSYFSDPNSSLRPEDVFTPYYYVHELAPTVKFWHPVPFGDDLPASRQNMVSDRYLCARTQQSGGHLYATRPPPLGHSNRPPGTERLEKMYMFGLEVWVTAVLRDGQKRVVGEIQADAKEDRAQLDLYGGKVDEDEAASPGLPCELVAVSKGFGRPEPAEPGKEEYTFYNVLWVQWEDGIAYRRGSGRVEREVWEALPKKDVDLILG